MPSRQNQRREQSSSVIAQHRRVGDQSPCHAPRPHPGLRTALRLAYCATSRSPTLRQVVIRRATFNRPKRSCLRSLRWRWGRATTGGVLDHAAAGADVRRGPEILGGEEGFDFCGDGAVARKCFELVGGVCAPLPDPDVMGVDVEAVVASRVKADVVLSRRYWWSPRSRRPRQLRRPHRPRSP
jgi:hypothetical protein